MVCLCFFPRVFLSSRVTGGCPMTTDLIMRVTNNVRTTYLDYIPCQVIFVLGNWYYTGGII